MNFLPRRSIRSNTTPPLWRRVDRIRLAWIGIAIIALALRVIGWNWDGGAYLHPDERFVANVTSTISWPDSPGQYFDTATSPLNHYNNDFGSFIYGTFPIYLNKALASIPGWLPHGLATWLGFDVDPVSGQVDYDTYSKVYVTGRLLSALADTGTVLLTGWITRRFFGSRAGLLAATLIAFTPLMVQTAHYSTVDSVAVFFATATCAATITAADRRSFGWFALAGVALGLAGASKPNYLITAGFLAIPIFEAMRRGGIDALVPWGRRRAFPVLPAVILAALVGFWTFRIGQPYAFAGPHLWNIRPNPTWINDLRYWRDVQAGLVDMKPSVQWVGRTPILYLLDTMVRWSMGPFTGLLSLLALVLITARQVRARRWPDWWITGFIVFCAAQIWLYGTNIAQAQRYLMIIYPYLIMFAAGFLVELVRRTRPLPVFRAWPAWARPAALLLALTVGYTIVYGIAYDSIFVRPITRIRASEWICDTIPAGTTLTAEYWDDGLPIPSACPHYADYPVMTMDLYGPEGEGSTKINQLLGNLNAADYIVLSSNRLIASIPRQPERYPIATTYYDMLLSGKLGFEPIAEFRQGPELGPLEWDDRGAEETTTVYEHPYVRIFKKTDGFDINAIYQRFAAAAGLHGGIGYLPGDPIGAEMLLSAAQTQALQEHGARSSMFDPESWVQDHPVIWWYIAVQLMALPAVLVCWRLFRAWPDGGWAMAKFLGLVLVAWLAWAVSSVTPIRWSPATIAIAWAVVGAVGVAVVWKHWQEAVRDLRVRWRWILSAELLFAVGFAVMTWVSRHHLPPNGPQADSSTGFYAGIFSALTRSVSFPTYDPFLAGGVLHWRYWGQMPWATLSRLTGIDPMVSMSLAIASIAALSLVMTWSIAGRLIAGMTGECRRTGALALLAPALVVMGGSLSVLRDIGRGAYGFAPRPGDWLLHGWVGDITWGVWRFLRGDAAADPGIVAAGTTSGHSLDTPFPLGSLLIGTLDPITTAMPFLILVIAMAVLIATREDRVIRRMWPFTRLDLGALLLGGIVAGSLQATVQGMFLPALAIISIAWVIRIVHAIGRDGSAWPVVRGIALAIAATVLMAAVAFWPFTSHFVTTARNTTSGPIPPLASWLWLLGGLLIVGLAWLAVNAASIAADARDEGWISLATTIAILAAAFCGIVATILIGSPIVFAALALLLVFLAIWRRQDEPAHLILLGFIGVGLGLLGIQGVLTTHVTVFKQNPAQDVSMFIWLLIGISATAALAWAFARPRFGQWRSIARIVAPCVAIALLIGAAAGPVLAVRALDAFSISRTLDASASRDRDTTDGDLRAAEWLNRESHGLPVVLEAIGPDGNGRISTLTGLPSVLAWMNPEDVMRPGWSDLVTNRRLDIDRMLGGYGDFVSIEPMLRECDVRYIYVGDLERTTYGTMPLRKFDDAVAAGKLTVVYRADGVTIYEYASPGQ